MRDIKNIKLKNLKNDKRGLETETLVIIGLTVAMCIIIGVVIARKFLSFG